MFFTRLLTYVEKGQLHEYEWKTVLWRVLFLGGKCGLTPERLRVPDVKRNQGRGFSPRPFFVAGPEFIRQWGMTLVFLAAWASGPLWV